MASSKGVRTMGVDVNHHPQYHASLFMRLLRSRYASKKPRHQDAVPLHLKQALPIDKLRGQSQETLIIHERGRSCRH